MLLFFFKQKTAYEVRISDGSSDVCSSDLPAAKRHHRSEDQDPARAVVEAGPRPDLAPAVAGEQVLELTVQRRRVGHGAIDMGVAQDPAPHLHARGMDIFVAHWILSCCLKITVGPAAAQAAAVFLRCSPDGVRSRRTARPRVPPETGRAHV